MRSATCSHRSNAPRTCRSFTLKALAPRRIAERIHASSIHEFSALRSLSPWKAVAAERNNRMHSLSSSTTPTQVFNAARRLRERSDLATRYMVSCFSAASIAISSQVLKPARRPDEVRADRPRRSEKR